MCLNNVNEIVKTTTLIKSFSIETECIFDTIILQILKYAASKDANFAVIVQTQPICTSDQTKR